MSQDARSPAQRLPYQSILDRPQLKLPDHARVVVWPVVNVEDWEISRPMARQVLPAPTAAPVLPDIANWSWHEYGMRVGFWRIKAALDSIGAKATLSVNGRVCETYPVVAGAARDAGWEFMAHGYIQMPTHQVDDQPAMIQRTVDTIKKFTGKAPVGWLGPGLTQTFDTVDHLARAGIRYIGDWAIDDQPMRFDTDAGSMVAMPYTVELNDIPMMAVQHHQSDVFLKRVTDTFDRLYQEGADQPRVMCMAVHPFLSGVPHRIRYFEEALQYVNRPGVLFWTGEQLLEWFEAQLAVGGQP
ncbi:polysaccharide deacetylase [Pusillimonas sp. T2]|uniref:polysaccharide deacetylase family protein n=1 Tax=Pusillimonas sp. T2 TaxID=1548123 RepID=UPI000B9D4813|nr:polysaccharide deacetylase family protein [Pusillimonas sp. T2]OXR48734.1 polysaccharide deacetylase [Pusillimonas sp. T2]